LLLLNIVGCNSVCINCFQSVNSCPIEHFLVAQSQLPENIWESGSEPSADQAPSRVYAEKIGTSFFTSSQGGIVQQVYRFSDLESAIRYYQEDVSGWYSQSEFETEWIMPDDFLDLPLTADVYDLRCSNSIYNGAEKCRFFAQYANDVIEMSVSMGAINHEQLTGLVIDIDQRMKECINNDKVNP